MISYDCIQCIFVWLCKTQKKSSVISFIISTRLYNFIQFDRIWFARHSLKFLLVRIQCGCFVASSLTCSRMALRIASRGICSTDHEATWMCLLFHSIPVSSLKYYNKAKYNMHIISMYINSRLSYTSVTQSIISKCYQLHSLHHNQFTYRNANINSRSKVND